MSKVIVIGGGISGLTAGIKLLNAGHQVTLIEKNKDVGGLCSGYFVDGFLVDTCIHWLMGTKKGNFINDLWREIGGLGRKVKIILFIKPIFLVYIIIIFFIFIFIYINTFG